MDATHSFGHASPQFTRTQAAEDITKGVVKSVVTHILMNSVVEHYQPQSQSARRGGATHN
ncbi:hypothetical protein BH11PLA2_BH11PLA2_31670 [soil metagenome]